MNKSYHHCVTRLKIQGIKKAQLFVFQTIALLKK